jgi:hypothetical protein
MEGVRRLHPLVHDSAPPVIIDSILSLSQSFVKLIAAPSSHPVLRPPHQDDPRSAAMLAQEFHKCGDQLC